MKATTLNLAVVTETWPPEINGVALTCEKMVLGMLRKGHRITLFRPKQIDTYPDIQGLQHHLLQGFQLPWYKQVTIGLPSVGNLKKAWVKNRPDLVVIVTEGPLGFSALLAARKLQIPVISEFHTNFHQYSQYYHLGFLLRLANQYLRWFHNQSRMMLVPTQQLKQELYAMGFNNLAVVARGIDTHSFHPLLRSELVRKSWGLSLNQLAVIHVGRLANEKNLGLAVKSFRAIQKTVPNAKMIFIGDGPARIALQKAHPDFIFCGMKTGLELGTHYASGDLFLSPSTSETFGNVTLEAMASEVAIVCFDYAAAREYVKNMRNGISVTLGDERQFIENAIKLAKNAPLRRRLAQQAFRDIQSLSWQNTIDLFEQKVLSMADIALNTEQTIGEENNADQLDFKEKLKAAK